ncbi:MAG: ribonuclease HII [Holophaga sp.]|nr:ribonuclease HII [Holophaga sp.]
MPPLKRNPLDWDLGNVPPGIAWGGVDEAGRGAWAGPVVAACAVLDPDTVKKWGHVLRGARDSKKLSPERREALAAELKLALPAWSVAEVDNLGIDRENILQATLEAMRQSVTSVKSKPKILFVDGNCAPRSGIPERLLVEGDSLSCAIACASILAKTHRDALMRDLDPIYPVYGFARHKGYGTPEHQKALKEHGACGIHRISYAPVAAVQQLDESIWEILLEELDTHRDVDELQAWVNTKLRHSYGALKSSWVDDLRDRYAQKLASLALGSGIP